MFNRRNQYIFSNQKRRKRAATRRIVIIVLVIAALAFALVWFLGKRGANIKTEIENQKVEQEPTVVIEEPKDEQEDTSQAKTEEESEESEAAQEDQKEAEPEQKEDQTAPVITLKKDKISILEGTEYDILADASAKDDSDGDVELSLDGELDTETPGTQTLKVIATDASGNTAEKEVTVNVIGIQENMPDADFETPTGHKAAIRDGVLYVDDILVVNKSFSVPEDYGNGMDPETQEAFYRLSNAAANDGLYIDVNTGYRSYAQQSNFFWYYADTLGEGIETTSSIMPGHSEHQTGLAMDINSTSLEFAYAVEGIWLNNNCADYGFIMRYPEGKEDITGYSWEPWHIRYVGEDLAQKLYNDGDWITLEEYFGLPSYYPES